MTEYASELKKDFPDLLQATAQDMGLDAALVEKDYYIVRALAALQQELPDYFIFKGGTCLSKAWRLLDRFSEDIDLLMTNPDNAGEKARNRRMKELEAVVTKCQDLKLDTEDPQPAKRKGVHRAARFEHPQITDSIAGPGNKIKLEMGYRGPKRWCEDRDIESFVTTFARKQGIAGDAKDLSPVRLQCADVRLIFVEKLFAAFNHYETDLCARKARHYYDLFKLSGIEAIQEFAGGAEYKEMFREVRALAVEQFPDTPLPPEDGFGDAEFCNPNADDFRTLKAHYKRELADLCFGQPPEFEEVIEAIRALVRDRGL